MLKLNKSHAMMVALKQELIRAQEAAKQWEMLATTDDLTGLHNRRMLYELDKKIEDRRNPKIEREVAMLFIDLDDFGLLNKKYGDDVGDEALRLVGQTIRQNIRCDDIAIRKGGDEFVIILIGSTPDLTNESVIKRLNTMLNGGLYLNHANISIPIKGSMGVYHYDDNITPFENLKLADVQMRAQKSTRKAANTSSPTSGDDGAII
jgi:two-component system cell cycle response regulator